ncbi:hypothetical protein LTR84_011207 [Exophiala bonariae]|uniref:Uncharacterized protein n=1 Tax=Exophiala bonariae TaxID=1690606 RepID=A0AAV9NIP5_9EURO|nr:hypothetical protein LTR84_011207 [Exophiala bonariae]
MSAMKSLLLLLPILRLGAAQQPSVSGVVATSTVTATPVVVNGDSTGVATATIEPSNSAISVFSGSGAGGTAAAPTTTIDFSVISENGTVITLTFTGSVDPSVNSTVYVTGAGNATTTTASSKGSGTAVNAGTTTSSRSGTASTTGTGPAQFTNAAPTADVQFGLGLLGFAGAAVALGL